MTDRRELRDLPVHRENGVIKVSMEPQVRQVHREFRVSRDLTHIARERRSTGPIRPP